MLPEAEGSFYFRRVLSSPNYGEVKEGSGGAGIRGYALHTIDLSKWEGDSDLTQKTISVPHENLDPGKIKVYFGV